MSDTKASTSNDKEIPVLPAYGADATQISLSGLSSGGFMTTQLHVAYSKRFMGAGVLAAGPFYCAGSYETNSYMINAETTCMNPIMNFMGPDGRQLYRKAQVFADRGDIDSLDNLKDDRVYIFTGKSDDTVKSSVVEQTKVFYEAAGISEDCIHYDDSVDAGHAILTENLFDHECSVTEPPYINQAGFFHSHHLLEQIYNRDGQTLNAPTVEACGQVISFNQHEFIRAQFKDESKKEQDRMVKLSSMSEFGFAYIPSGLDPKTCRIHIVFHGCEQGYTEIGSDYFLTTGYNQMAATNNMIVLYPQVEKSAVEPFNPKGCWDFWGYSSVNPWEPNFYTQDAIQMKAVIGMLDRLTSTPKNDAKEQTTTSKANTRQRAAKKTAAVTA
ncbi:poly(3-hydroxybutyrate) depolymerase [Candidatus Albibeggiatoa sp. nov. NOAA]|uniref:extracellular catalytic domain type 2 short-chain-length polyhydroxyalkanoate depolymerase n=1 Tax=Candidatus Albibeggiatoa sp. nov. NOAA TaxID=3162724 RepID=UPI0032FF8B31|nr:poly(3-hydroxybutyrate) depolymerase [Thiotrichaceae bacterium]